VLPWTNVVAPGALHEGLLAVSGLALVNVVLPLAILRLAARRRPWTLKLLMALPLSVAVPLNVFLAAEPLIPVLPPPFPGSARILFALGTLSGIPVVVGPIAIGWCLIRRRWKTLALLLGLTILMSFMIGAVWLWFDMRSMPAIEHYAWSGWYLVVIPGVYGIGMLILIARATGGSVRLVDRLRRADRDGLLANPG
jgi:hypothetical protein